MARNFIYREWAAILFRVVSIVVHIAVDSKHNALTVWRELQICVNLSFSFI